MCTSPHDLRQGPFRSSRSVRRCILSGMLAVLAALSLVGPGVASAQESGPANPGFTITPYSEGNLDGVSSRSAIVIDVAPGQTLTDRVSVFNFTAEPITFQLYAADAVPAKGTGAFSLQLPDATTGALPIPEDVGTWIDVPVETFTAEPGTRSDIPVTISVPLDAEPGDHAGGVVALNVKPLEGAGDLAVDIKQAVGTRVYARVDGPLSSELTVSEVEVSTAGQAWLAPIAGPKDAVARFTVNNTGNVRLTPTVTVTVKDMFGREVKTVEVGDFQELLPGTSVDATAALGDLSGFGPRYSVDVTTSTPDFSRTTSRGFWVIPWALIFVLVVVIVTVVVMRRRNRPATGSSGDGGGPGGERDPSSPAAGPAATTLEREGLVGVGVPPEADARIGG